LAGDAFDIIKEFFLSSSGVFCRFRQLSIFNSLKAQHNLILLEERLQYDYKTDQEGDHEALEVKDLGEASMRTVSGIKSPKVALKR
jgi:hypothetical protein